MNAPRMTARKTHAIPPVMPISSNYRVGTAGDSVSRPARSGGRPPDRSYVRSTGLLPVEVRGRWWNGSWGRMARRDIWLLSDGRLWRVRGRLGGDGGQEIVGPVTGRSDRCGLLGSSATWQRRPALRVRGRRREDHPQPTPTSTRCVRHSASATDGCHEPRCCQRCCHRDISRRPPPRNA
jgi:hypothetical protein